MPGIESEGQTERSKTVARWFAIVLLAALVYRQQHNGTVVMPATVYSALLGGAVAINLLHAVYLFRGNSCSAYYKYLSVGLDLTFISILIRYSGFNQSPYFYLYFLVLVSNCIRYGLLMSLYMAVAVNVLYISTLSLAPELHPTVVGGEGLKILAFWGVALYGGAVAARMRRQGYEIEAYEETIAELRTRLHQLEGERRDETTPATILPAAAEHLPLLSGEVQWIKTLAPVGVALLLLAALLTVVAPSVLWFLLYPLLLIGALAALATATSWLLRHLHL